MPKVTAFALIATILLVGYDAAPSAFAEAEPEQAQADTPKDESSMLDTVAGQIYLKREEFKSMPGRTGILAEEPLYSVFAEEVIIRDFFQDREGGFFLDVGASWPVKGSNTYYLEENLGWTGIGIDALDDYAPKWEELRPKSKFFAFLITNKSGGEGIIYKSKGLGLSSTNESLAAGRMFGKEEETVPVSVPMITLNDLLDREGVEKVDLVSMDIEGHEPKALAGFDIERFAPDLIVVEGKNKKVTQYMKDHGYVEVERYKKFDSVNRYFAPAGKAGP